MRAGEADVGFTDGPGAPLGLRSEVVASEEIVPVVGRRHPWFGRRRGVGAQDLVGATLALPPSGSGTLDVVAAALAPFQFGAVGARVEVASSAAARVAALSGGAVALLPGCRVTDEIARGTLAAVAVRDVRIEQPVRAVWRGMRPPVGCGAAAAGSGTEGLSHPKEGMVEPYRTGEYRVLVGRCEASGRRFP